MEPAPVSRAEKSLRFPKSARLTETAQFRRVKERGASLHGRLMVLGVLKTDAAGQPARIGFITSKRVGGAVVRNFVRRRLREIARLHRPRMRAGIWLVVIARGSAARADFASLEKEWLSLARRAGALEPPPEAA